MAAALGKTALRSWPAPPHVPDNPAADCIGVINDATELLSGYHHTSLRTPSRRFASMLIGPKKTLKRTVGS